MLIKPPVYGFVLFLITLSAGCAFFDTAPGRVTIVNSAITTIRHATVVVSDETLVINNLEPQEQVTLGFTINRESGYKVVALFDDGRELRADIGYVAVGLRTDDVITIGDNEIRDATPRRQTSAP